MIEYLRQATEPRAIASALSSVLSAEQLRRVAGSGAATNDGDPWDLRRLRGLQSLVVTLAESLTRSGVVQWLHAENRLLGGRVPLDVLAGGEVDEVVAAAASFIDGAYV